MTYVMGVDLGTSSLKIIIVDKNGKIIDQVSNDYKLITEDKGYSEQNPQDWIDAFERGFKSFDTSLIQKVDGLSVSGQMHSLVLLDNNQKVLRNAILWNDTRTTEQCRQIEAQLDIVGISSNKAIEGFTLPKILWVQQNEPEIWKQTAHILMPKDYLNFYLTGEIRTDYSDASGTLMLDFQKQMWSKIVLNTFSIDEKLLPPIIHSQDVVGTYQDIKVFCGGADNACGSLSTGLHDESTAMLSIGTSGVFLSLENTKNQDYKGSLHYFSHVIPDMYYSMGVTLSAGYSLSWFKNMVSPETSFDAFLEPIDTINQMESKLLFTPYIMGERTPHFDSNVRGTFMGLDTQHTLNHLKLAVLQGITFSLRDSYEIMKRNGKKFNHIVSVGGGSKSNLWLQLQADIFGVEVSKLGVEEGPAFGSAMIASVGLGWFDSYEACIKAFINLTRTFYPRDEYVAFYNTLYNAYRDVYRRLI